MGLAPNPPDVHSIQRSIANHVEYTLAGTRFNFDAQKAYLATAHRYAPTARPSTAAFATALSSRGTTRTSFSTSMT